MPVTTIAQLSNFSKAYISQVKSGKRPPSQNLVDILRKYNKTQDKYESIQSVIEQFLNSRREGLSSGTVDFYRLYLNKAVSVLGISPSPKAINSFFVSLSCSPGGKHAYFRSMRAFYRWLYSPRSGIQLEDKINPILFVDAPKVPKKILPSLTSDQVTSLIEKCSSVRDKAIISLFAESGLRLSELARIRAKDINWENKTIKIIGKGNKEGYAPFSSLTESFLRQWLNEQNTSGNVIW